MLKYLFIKLFIRDVKRYIAISGNRDINSKSGFNNTRGQNSKVLKEKLVKSLSAIATLIAYIILFLSRKYRDSLIDILIFILVIIQTIIAVTIIISTLRGGERHIHRPFF